MVMDKAFGVRVRIGNVCMIDGVCIRGFQITTCIVQDYHLERCVCQCLNYVGSTTLPGAKAPSPNLFIAGM